MSERQLTALYGKDRRGVCAPEAEIIEISDDGETARLPFVDNLSFHRPHGLFVGATLHGDLAEPSVTVMYGEFEKTSRNPLSCPTIGQPTNKSVAACAPNSFEERMRQRIYRFNQDFHDLAVQHGLDADAGELRKLRGRIANIISKGVVAEFIANTTTASNAGALAVTREFALVLRQKPLWTAEPEHRFASQALSDVPAFLFFLSHLRRHAGVSRKALCAGVGLLPQMRFVLPQTISALSFNRFGRGRFKDASLNEDLGWLNREEVLVAFKDMGVMRQRPVADMASRIAAISGNDVAADFANGMITTLGCIKNEGEIHRRLRQQIIDYVTASQEMLAKAGIKPWNPKLSLAEWENRGRAFLDFCLKLEAARERQRPFPAVEYAPDCGKLSPRGWRLRPLVDEMELILFGAHLHNCAGSYGARCRAGVSSLFVTARRPICTDDPNAIFIDPKTSEPLIIGSMVELQRGSDGNPIIAQHFAHRNSQPNTTLRVLVQSWVERFCAKRAS
jgi:hypothetical protein